MNEPTDVRQEAPMVNLGHRIRSSDASSFDEICDICGATDRAGSYALKRPCAPMNNPQRPTDAGCVEQCDLDAATPWLFADPTQVTASNPLVQAFARHRLAALSASGGDTPKADAPSGYAVVPINPTEAMYNAGYDATRLPDGTPQFVNAGFCLGHAGNIYRAMIGAAPTASGGDAAELAAADMRKMCADFATERAAKAEIERLKVSGRNPDPEDIASNWLWVRNEAQLIAAAIRALPLAKQES